MKVLFYSDPTYFIERGGNSAGILVDHFYFFLMQSWGCEDKDVKTLVPEWTHIGLKKNRYDKYFNSIPIYKSEILKNYKFDTSLEELFIKQYSDKGFSRKEKEYFKELTLKKLNGWVPDIIFCFSYLSPFLRELFPDVLILAQENAIFSSRAPFMRSLFYDPCGFGRHSFLNKYSNEINNFAINEEQNILVESLKNGIVNEVEKHNTNKDIISEYRKKFSKLILLPLATTCGSPQKETEFTHDFYYTDYLMQSLPQDIGVVVTQHDIGASVLNQHMVSYLKAKYPNFIFLNNHGVFSSASLNIFAHVDAVVNLSSGTGLQAILWDKPVIAMDKKFSHWFSDKVGIDGIQEFLEKPVKSKNNLIYWYLTHYCMFENRLSDSEWLNNYFTKKLDKFKKDGIRFDFYEQIEDFELLSKYIIDYVKEQYKQTCIAQS